jgi:hypothetical protein
MSQAKLCRRGLSSDFSSCRICTLYTQRRDCFQRTLCTVARGICSSRDARRIDFLWLWMNAIRTFSDFSSEPHCRPPCPFKTLPVSSSLLCHALNLSASGAAFW